MTKKSIRILSILLSAVLLIACLGTIGVSAETPDYETGTPKIGIDVSYYQGDIDWQQVKNEVDFAIIRVGYTGYGNLSMNVDTKFEEYVAGATAAGIPIGVYYYGSATSAEMAVEEAKFVLEQLAKYPATFSYPIIYDIEVAEDKNANVPPVATQVSKAFCDTIRAAGYYPMVYSYTSYFNPYITTADISDNDFWQAHYYTSYSGLTTSQLIEKAGSRPSILGNYDSNISIWQCTSEGSVSGISGNVDVNIGYFDYDAFIRSEGYNGYTKTTGDDRVAVCAGSSVNIRSGASTAFEAIGTATYGEEFKVNRFYNKTWIEIVYDGQPAYVHSDYFTLKDSGDSSDSGNYIVKEYAVCTGSTVNIRSEANTECEILGQAVNGDEFLLIEDLGEWLKIEYNDAEAYIYAEYTSIKVVKELVEDEPDNSENTDGENGGNEDNNNEENPEDNNGDDETIDTGNTPVEDVPEEELTIWQKIGRFFASIFNFFKGLFTKN